MRQYVGYFEREGYGRERLLNAIKVESRAAIDTVLQELRAGRPFAEVARARSLDERSAKRGGELGFIGRDQLESLHIPPVVFKTLPQDQLSEPLPAGSAWHILRFSEDRAASYEKYQARIASLLYQKRLAEVEAEHLEQLRDSFKVRLNSSALRELVNAYQARQPARIEGNSTALYTYKDGEITLGQVQEFFASEEYQFWPCRQRPSCGHPGSVFFGGPSDPRSSPERRLLPNALRCRSSSSALRMPNFLKS